MVGGPQWTEESLGHHYHATGQIDLGWLNKPTRHQFRWRSLKGPWITSRRRISSGESLIRDFASAMPTDVYVSTSSWLNPVNLPRLKDKKRPDPIILDHMVVFDIDMRPFCRKKLDEARVATLELREWLLSNTDLEIQHVSFSGSKGFHLIANDPDRSAFSEPDAGIREELVREQRKELLDRVIAAGHPVDPVVTADTRRIIRVPGTLHGSTGWVCTILEDEWLEVPISDWVENIQRHDLAVKMPKRPPFALPRLKLKQKSASKPKKSKSDNEEYVSIEVSSHVQGTKDRSALVTWLPARWGEPIEAVNTAQEKFDRENIGPVAYWYDGSSVLAIIPRAIPRDFLLSRLSKIGLKKFDNNLRKFEHSWIRVSGRMSGQGWESELEPITVLGYDASARCRHPWSSSHVELCNHLGLPIIVDSSDLAGNKDASIRIAVRR